jgi:PAS domain S-box-containing protein
MGMSVEAWVAIGALTVLVSAFLAAVYMQLYRRYRFTRTQLTLMQSEQERMHHAAQASEENRRRKEDALRAKEELYAELLRSTCSMVCTYSVTPDGLPSRFTDVNDVMCRALEYDRDTLLTMTPMDIEPAPEAAMPGFTRSQLVTVSDAELAERRRSFAIRDAQAMIKRIMDETRVTMERVFIARNGRRIPVRVTACRLRHSEVDSMLCTAHDISEQEEAQRALRESRGRFQDVFSNSPIGMALYDANRALVMVNRACLSMFGIPDRNEFGAFNMFDNPFLPDDIRGAMQRGDSCRYEATIDFEKVREQALFVTAKRGKAHVDIQFTNLGLDRDYKPQGYLAQFRDITKRVRAEAALRQSERQLRQAQKMEAIGRLAGGIAHDFNNILTPILGYTEMTLYATEKDTPAHEYMQEVLKASNRAKDLVNQILTFSRHSDKEGRPIRVTPIVKEVLKLIAAALPANIEVQRVLKTDRDVILAEPTQIHQVLMNLCTNAVHAMEGSGGTLEVRMMDFVIGGRARSEFPDLAPGRYLRISIKDSGIGMAQETLDRIFEPFFTTKDGGKGTGMGLSVVHGIVSSLRGVITAESAIGQGATFHVVLPVVEQQERDSTLEDVQLPAGHASVLFVDDSAEIATLAERMLKALEYVPVIAASAQQALDLFRERPQRFDLVITDQVMPGMTGLELARALLALRQDIPIVLCTGYSESVCRQEIEEAGIRGFITKPIAMRDLADVIRKTLRAGSAGFVRKGA